LKKEKMANKLIISIVFLVLIQSFVFSQNYSFNFNTSGRRVCLVSSEVDTTNRKVNILFLDSLSNSLEPLIIYRRLFGTKNWIKMATAIPPGSGHWTDDNVAPGDIWEYQVKRQNTWSYLSKQYDATGYTIACMQSDNTKYKGQMILLVANDITDNLYVKYIRLKREIAADGWLVNDIVVPRASSWDCGSEVVNIKNQISNFYNNAPLDDKPKVIFILGHVPLPRCGSSDLVAPDDHNANKGARGCDSYYADIDGVFTDTATYNPEGLATSLALNKPGDFKWDQDFFPSDLEMAFGRIDFADLTEISSNELVLIENYLDRLSNYKNVVTGFDMGDKTAFYSGYDNSNDGSYRSLPNISTPVNFYQNNSGANHNQWVLDNGPFKVYMQNRIVPDINDWLNYGMNATVYSSDQSYWGFGDAPQPNGLNGRIRALLGIKSKCLIALWTTTGINIFHQACSGLSLGESFKEIMNHNATNQYLEKPPQDFDTPDWWNRTHFAFWGDPTLNLYQIAPPSNIHLTKDSDNNAVLNWTKSVDTNVIGYHIYLSNNEFGKFERITNSIITGNNFIIPNYQSGTWYMVKAVRFITSGCGIFLHSSLGKEIKGNIVLNSENTECSDFQVFPNPVKNLIYIQSSANTIYLNIYSVSGEIVYEKTLTSTNHQIDISHLKSGVYIIRLTGLNRKILSVSKFCKS
jgi:hypothetical protein